MLMTKRTKIVLRKIRVTVKLRRPRNLRLSRHLKFSRKSMPIRSRTDAYNIITR